MEAIQIQQDTNVEVTQHMLSFCLDKEIFAVHVNKVIEIIEVPKISKLPRAKKYMMGVINVRGTVLPLIDTRVKLGMDAIEFTVNTCAIIIEIEKGNQIAHLGILVDSVLEVLEINEEQIQPTPSMEQEVYADFITGIITWKNDFVLILDLDALFSREEIQQLKVAVDDTEWADEEKIEPAKAEIKAPTTVSKKPITRLTKNSPQNKRTGSKKKAS